MTAVRQPTTTNNTTPRCDLMTAESEDLMFGNMTRTGGELYIIARGKNAEP